MTRHQFHRRTLDALELRGGVYMLASDLRAGDTILRLAPCHDVMVEAVEASPTGDVRIRSGNDTASECLGAREVVCVRRTDSETTKDGGS